MDNILDNAYESAKQVIEKCSTNHGLFASAGKKAYRGVWSRDSFISLFAAEKEFKEVFKKSLITLEKNQSIHGQIPNAVLKFEAKKPEVDYLSIDSTLWYIIGHYTYKKAYGNSLFNKKSIQKALEWLENQDLGENKLLVQLPTTDWQDAFPHRYGYTINTQALYYYVLSLTGKKSQAKKLKNLVNNSHDWSLWQGNFYYSYRWKNHGKYKEIGNWFDSLGNLLAIIFDLADESQAEKIISYIKSKKINQPYALKAISPPIKPNSKYWQNYYLDCEAGKPYHYLNAGVWPFIGGFYVLALIKLKKFKEAEQELTKLAEINLKGNFPEWINPKNIKTYGSYQAWSAGTYTLAYNSLKKKRVLI
ncbi:MAG: glycoside hydrolase 100 family protein [Candidatus Pacearchaeota archaeon]